MLWYLVPVLVLGVAGFYGWVAFRRFAERVQNQFEHATGVAAFNPYCNHLERFQDPEWDDEETVRELTRQLKAEGFGPAGQFMTQPEFRFLRVLCHPEQSVYAVIQEPAGQEVTLDLFTPYADGRFVSASTADPNPWPDPPTQPVTRCPEAEPAELLERLLRVRPAEGVLPTSPGQFADTYLRWRRQAMVWMLERGGPTDDELRDQLGRMEIPMVSTLVLDMARNQWQAALNAALQDQMRDQFVASIGAPPTDNVVVVHDRFGPGDLMNLIDDVKENFGADDSEDDLDYNEEDDLDQENMEGEFKRLQGLLARSNARQVFAQLNAQLALERRLTKIGSMDHPVPADVYLKPARR